MISFKTFSFYFHNWHQPPTPGPPYSPARPQVAPHSSACLGKEGNQNGGLPRHAGLTSFWGPAPESLGKTLNTQSGHFTPSPSLWPPRVEKGSKDPAIQSSAKPGSDRLKGRGGPSQIHGFFWHQRNWVRTWNLGHQGVWAPIPASLFPPSWCFHSSGAPLPPLESGIMMVPIRRLCDRKTC